MSMLIKKMVIVVLMIVFIVLFVLVEIIVFDGGVVHAKLFYRDKSIGITTSL